MVVGVVVIVVVVVVVVVVVAIVFTLFVILFVFLSLIVLFFCAFGCWLFLCFYSFSRFTLKCQVLMMKASARRENQWRHFYTRSRAWGPWLLAYKQTMMGEIFWSP